MSTLSKILFILLGIFFLLEGVYFGNIRGIVLLLIGTILIVLQIYWYFSKDRLTKDDLFWYSLILRNTRDTIEYANEAKQRINKILEESTDEIPFGDLDVYLQKLQHESLIRLHQMNGVWFITRTPKGKDFLQKLELNNFNQ